ncbi:MAG: heme ABC transporter ATP-binding protein [Halioglobus sp.]|nr:heme ABC transporter ATP-binding protein [Halioglobus sp.]
MSAGAGDAIALRLDTASAAPWGRPLLQTISMALSPGTVLALAGPNGAGKSSLLQLIAGDIPLAGGRLELNGKPLRAWSHTERAQQIAYLPQMSLLNFPYTVREVALLGRIPHNSGAARDTRFAEQAMRATDTLTLGERLYTRLSGGEKQRTQLARVFAQIEDEGSLAGKVLLLDEPTSALDLAHQEQILSAVHALADRGCAVILVIHDLNLAARVADQLLVLDAGRQIALGTPSDVLTVELLRAVFHVDVTLFHAAPGGVPVIMPNDRARA